MGTALMTRVEAVFNAHDSDGEFTQPDRTVAWSMLPPLHGDDRVFFTTKPAVVCGALQRASTPVTFGMVGRYGLPQEEDVRWLANATRSCQLLFLGDMDPVDLLLFAWLRQAISPRAIAYVGLGAALLSPLGIRPGADCCLRLAPSEAEVIPFVAQALPDLGNLLGADYAALLMSGGKIELEGMLGSPAMAASLLQSALPRSD